MGERPGFIPKDYQSPLPEQRPEQGAAWDERWSQKFEELGIFTVLPSFEGDPVHRQDLKGKFLAGEIDNPEFDYPNVGLEQLATREKLWLQLKQEIKSHESVDAVRLAYRWAINEKIAEIRMLQATARGDMRRFDRWARFVNGEPSPEIFHYIVGLAHQEREKLQENPDPAVQALMEEVDQLLPAPAKKLEFSSLPTEAEISRLKEFTEKKMGPLIALAGGGEGTLNRDQIQAACDQALAVIKADGWKTVLEQGSRITVMVNPEEKTISLPTAVNLTQEAKDMAKFLIHEIGIHVGRKFNGKRSKLSLLGVGMDRFIVGEEGVTYDMEASLDQKVDPFDVDMKYILAIGLAQGIDGHKRDFRGVFDILKKQWTLREVASGKALPEAEKSATETAYNTCVRIFRGTDCKTPGVCYPKDMVYREGTLGVWQVIRENPQEMHRFTVGKYDPTNARHIWVMDELGIKDEDLDEMEKAT